VADAAIDAAGDIERVVDIPAEDYRRQAVLGVVAVRERRRYRARRQDRRAFRGAIPTTTPVERRRAIASGLWQPTVTALSRPGALFGVGALASPTVRGYGRKRRS
jgi:hypothetical protein